MARSTVSFRRLVSDWRPMPCGYCGALLLQVEQLNFCCQRGRDVLEPLPPYPLAFKSYVQSHRTQINSQSRKVNNLFAFSSLGVEGEFKDLGRPANVILSGRTYHQTRDIDHGQHSLRWYLYDSHERDREAVRIQVPLPYINAVRQLLEEVSPYIQALRHAFQSLERTVPASIILASSIVQHEITSNHYTT